MENNKTENKSEKCCKLSLCNHGHMGAIFVGIILLFVVFASGLAIGHGFDRDGGRGGYGGYGGCGRFDEGRNDLRKFAPIKNNLQTQTGNTEIKDTANVDKNQNATSSLNQ